VIQGILDIVTISAEGKQKLLIHHILRRSDMTISVRPSGNSKEDQLLIDQMWEENHRLSHLTTVLIQHLGTTKESFPLSDIDKQMKLFDEEHRY
jgi:hypothetical protein